MPTLYPREYFKDYNLYIRMLLLELAAIAWQKKVFPLQSVIDAEPGLSRGSTSTKLSSSDRTFKLPSFKSAIVRIFWEEIRKGGYTVELTHCSMQHTWLNDVIQQVDIESAHLPAYYSVKVDYHQGCMMQRSAPDDKWAPFALYDCADADKLEDFDIETQVAAIRESLPSGQLYCAATLNTIINDLATQLTTIKEATPLLLEYARIEPPLAPLQLPHQLAQQAIERAKTSIAQVRKDALIEPLNRQIEKLEQEIVKSWDLSFLSFSFFGITYKSSLQLKPAKKRFLETFRAELLENCDSPLNAFYRARQSATDLGFDYADVIAGMLRHETLDLLKKYVGTEAELLANPAGLSI